MSHQFNSIESIVADLQAGKMVIVVDDADRENEGDLIIAAQLVTPEAVNFMAKQGGVLQRAGHTEATVDLVKLAGCRPIGVICEIMSEDGSMARLPELIKIAQKHRLKICTIADLIKYRRTREKLVERVEVVKLPTEYGDFDLYLYRSKLDGQHQLALTCGEVAGKQYVLVIVHSE